MKMLSLAFGIGRLAQSKLVLGGCVLATAGAIWLPSIEALIKPSAVVGARASSGGSVPDVTILQARPLFHASRRSSRQDTPAQAEAQVPLTFETAYVIKGVMRVDDRGLLIVEHRQTRRSYSVAPGQFLDGHRLQLIDSAGAIFENSERQRINLPRPAGP
jgi:hypothetical protein